MHRTTRLLGILIALQARPQTAQRLAERFEVSRRTILRDIEELTQLDVPITARTGPRGGFAIPRSWWLAPMQLSDDEVRTLLLALDHLGPEGDGPTWESHDRLMDKLRSSLQPAALDRAGTDPARPRVVANVAPSSATVETIRRAIGEATWVRIAYGAGSAPGERRILPLDLHVADGRWYTRAIDERSGGTRHFRLDRIATIHGCLPPPEADAIVAGATSMPAYHDAAHPEIVVRLTERGQRFAADHADLRGHLDGKMIRFRCPPAELPYYGRELLRLGTEAIILGPPELQGGSGSTSMHCANIMVKAGDLP
jgi:predicted DNA-binding transcriptional regulator YafY